MALWVEPEESVSRQPWGAERVLVAVVPSRRDWALVCDEGWYRIPLARAPRHLSARYLAFYHPSCLGETRWSIPCYAPIQRYAVVPRRTLFPDEAGHPRCDDLYYRLDLGPLIALPHAILSRRLRRLTFLMTTLDRLLAADEIDDLWLRASVQGARRRAMTMGEAAVLPAYAA